MPYHDFLKDKLLDSLKLSLKEKKSKETFNKSQFNLEIPNNKKFGDISTNIAMVFSKKCESTPSDLAMGIVTELKKNKEIDKLEIVGPGFINIFFKTDFWQKQLKDLLENIDSYKYKIEKKKICLEFVSANPTGLMHIGHARGAVLGDTIASILQEVGHEVIREYYINDAGEQIKVLNNTIDYHLDKKNGNKSQHIKDIYPGDYLKLISEKILNYGEKSKNDEDQRKIVDLIMEDIKSDLKKIKVDHDSFISEKKIANKKNVADLKIELEKKKLVYLGFQDKPKSVENNEWVKKKQLLFKSKLFGDDTDRALLKPNGELTYFMSDIIYHQNKIDRGFDTLINIWGIDHSGYVKRLKVALEALNEQKKYIFEIKLTSLVNLLEGTKKLKMSKRKGNYVTLRDVVEEVGSDVLRFMMISRNADKKIDFDFDLVQSKSKDNPVFYVQYAYARCISILNIFKKTFECSFESLNTSKIILSNLILEEERIIIKKLCNYLNVIISSATYYEPHRITNYLYDLAKDFHAYWGLGKIDSSKKIILDQDRSLSESRVFLIFCISEIIRKAMKLLNIKCPERM